jgi:hypothetical protein
VNSLGIPSLSAAETISLILVVEERRITAVMQTRNFASSEPPKASP